MARQPNAASDEIAAIEALMSDLEKRLRKLNTTAKQQASDVSTEVSEALSDIAERLRTGAQTLSGTVANEASRLGNEALEMGGDVIKRIEDEVEQRPLVALAIAAGIGFLIGIAGRRR